MTATTGSIVIGSAARALHGEVGLTAWAALEELLLEARPQGRGVAGVEVSARSLAERLGVSKDTAAGALRRLTAAGVVRRQAHRDPVRGVFGRSVYLFDVDRLAAAGVDFRAITSPAPVPARHRRVGRAGTQGELFETTAAENR